MIIVGMKKWESSNLHFFLSKFIDFIFVISDYPALKHGLKIFVRQSIRSVSNKFLSADIDLL